MSTIRWEKLDEAISFFEDAVQTATQMGWLSNRMKALGYLSRIAIAQNNQEQAYRHLQEIHFMDYFNHRSESGQEIHNECDLYQNVPWNYFFEALIAFAEYQVKFEDAQKGLAILQYISEHRYTEPRDQNQAKVLLDELQKNILKSIFQKALEEGKSLRLEQIIQDLKSFNSSL